MDTKFYNKNIGDVIKLLKADTEKGLSQQEAVKRQKEYGYNEFTKPKQISNLQKLGQALTEQLIIILLIAAGISLLIKEYHDAIGICIAVLLGITIGMLTESKSQKAAEALAKMTDDISVKVLRNGMKITVHKKDIVPGDIVFLESGDRVPADGRVLIGVDLKVREDMLTGESDDVSKCAAPPNQVPEQKNILFGGTLIAYGNASMLVTSIADATEMGKIAKELGDKEEDTPLQIKMNELGKRISGISTAIAGILFIYMLIQILQAIKFDLDFSGFKPFLTSLVPLELAFPDIKTAFVVCVALIVAAVPEGLPTMINITLAITMKQMAKINVLIRKKEACETIGAVSIICSDKTGTLTKNQMTVEEVYLEGRKVPKETIDTHTEFLNNCMINSTADIGFEEGQKKYMGSATECALLLLCEQHDYNSRRKSCDIVRQIPFTSQNKYMLTTIKTNQSYEVLSKGAPEIVLEQCGYECINGHVITLTEKRKKEILSEIMALQNKARRVIGFAYRQTADRATACGGGLLDKQLIFNGFVGIYDPLREGVKESILMAQEGGIQTKMLTGDNLYTAVAIGNELGLLEGDMKAVEASYIDGLSDKELKEELKSIAIVARSKPTTKMRIVQALQKSGEVVAVTGDGINDAPALTKADVGIAMGISGTEVSKNAADIILTNDSFSTIVEAITWGRGIYNNFQRFIQFQLTVNIIAFMIAIISQVLGYRMPFTTIHLLWINIIMDGPPALALGLEPVRRTVMKRKPIPRDATIINKFMMRTIIINSLYITVLLFCQMKWNFLGARNVVVGNYASESQTVLFSLFAFSVLFNAFNCREFGTTSIFPNFMKNKLALKIIGITAVIQILSIQFLGKFFNAVPLTLKMWGSIIAMGASVVIVNEVVKLILRMTKKSTKRVLRSRYFKKLA